MFTTAASAMLHVLRERFSVHGIPVPSTNATCSLHSALLEQGKYDLINFTSYQHRDIHTNIS